jgi:hypothetical protein
MPGQLDADVGPILEDAIAVGDVPEGEARIGYEAQPSDLGEPWVSEIYGLLDGLTDLLDLFRDGVGFCHWFTSFGGMVEGSVGLPSVMLPAESGIVRPTVQFLADDTEELIVLHGDFSLGTCVDPGLDRFRDCHLEHLSQGIDGRDGDELSIGWEV